SAQENLPTKHATASTASPTCWIAAALRTCLREKGAVSDRTQERQGHALVEGRARVFLVIRQQHPIYAYDTMYTREHERPGSVPTEFLHDTLQDRIHVVQA
ncbi:unnamed protein product, partial [Ectocarpus sp. 12 AP-2014]